MQEYNLLGTLPKAVRDPATRMRDKEHYRAESLLFGQAYFDGTREYGYGGYYYDGRWKKIAEEAIKRYELKPEMKCLDIGCAKGFFVQDLRTTCSGLDAYGIDISEYAIENCHPDVRQYVSVGNAISLPYPDNYFDAVFAINVVHNLDTDSCITALTEISRVCKNPKKCFVQVDAYRTEEEKSQFEAWMLTAKTYCKPEDWHKLFKASNYHGDYFWTILQFNESKIE